MSKYVLFEKEIVFTEAEDRYCELQFSAWDAVQKAKKEFDEWYLQKQNIYNVLKGFADEATHLVEKYVVNPLYKTLSADYEIYDLSQGEYSDRCLDLSSAEKTHNEAIEVYEGIEEKLAEEREYREFRKANRSGVIGGGFGIGGMIAGMATAGAINMATGAAHSIVNSIGNAGSEGDANTNKTKLYNACRLEMAESIEKSILSTAFSHIAIVNEYIPNHIALSFNSEKSEALLESAKNVEAKQIELLIEAIKNCPWNYDIYSFAFEKFPKERRSLIEMSRNFRVDLDNDIDELLHKEYTTEAKKSEKLALIAKAKILEIMSELGISENKIIDEIEKDCLERLCFGYKDFDEKMCEQLSQKVKDYDALDKNKELFLKKIQERIEEIWAKEDGEIFDNYLLRLNVLDSTKIEEGIKFVKAKGRTSNAKKYLDALESFKQIEIIKKARKYRYCAKDGISPKLIKWSGAILAIIGLTIYMLMDDFSLWLHGFPLLIGIAIQIYIHKLEKLWKKLTINNKVIHPILSMNKEAFEKAYFNNQSVNTKK